MERFGDTRKRKEDKPRKVIQRRRSGSAHSTHQQEMKTLQRQMLHQIQQQQFTMLQQNLQC